MDSDPKMVLLYEDEDVQIAKEEAFPDFLYLMQDDFEGLPIDVVELNPAQQLALYAILKNRFEN
jgi:hypothetical protein